MSYDHTKSRVLQWTGIILILCIFAGAYWYFGVRASTLNAPQNDLNTTGLVGLWSFNGDDMSGTTAYDRSGSGNNGTLTNGPQVTQGKVGQALDFDGANDYVSTADYSYSNAQAFTMSVWFKADTVSGNQVIFSKATYEYNLRLTGSALAFSYWDTGANDEIGLYYSNVVANKWYLVNITYDGSGTAYMYVDGVRVASDTDIVDAFQNKTDVFRIGGGYYVSGNPGYLNGKIDEVRIYNRALTAGEVTSLYTQGGGTKSNTSISQPQGTGRLDSGLAGYWAMDNGSGTSATDGSTNANTGTLTNGPTWTTGQIGGAIDFDGTDDYITAGDQAVLEINNSSLSLGGWFKVDTYPSGNREFLITKGGTSGDYEYELNVNGYDSNKLKFSVYNTGTAEYIKVSSVTVPALGTWFHVLAVWDKDAVAAKMYYNGVLEGTSTSTTGSIHVTRTSHFNIGRRADSAETEFDGKADEIRVYNRALAADEVSQLYRLTSPTGVDTSLKGYWSFNGDDMSGTTAYDRSGAGNTGTLTNGPTKTIGIAGQALSFDGSNDYVDIANVSYTGTFTFSTWFYTSNNSQTGIIFGEDGGSVAGGPKIGMTGGNMFVRVNNTGGDSSVPVPTASQWHFMVVTRNSSSKVDLYIDGGTAIRLNGDATQTDNYDLDKIGCNGGTPDQCFTGKLDEVRIYNRALTASEVQSLYAAGGGTKVASAASQAQGTGRLDSGLAGYWPLDTGSGTTAVDASTNGNNGTLTNGPTWGTGQVGGAVTFDGTNDYITIAPTAAIKPQAYMTLSAWVKRNASGEVDYIFWERDASVQEEGIFFYMGSDNKLHGVFRITGTGYVDVASTTTITDTNWHMVTAVSGAANLMTFYIDGITGGSGTTTAPNTGLTINSAIIGARNGGGAPDIFGSLSVDEMRVYNRALSSDEVSQLYRLTSPTSVDTSLKGYWSFDGQDMNGTTAYDRSGAGNTGTLTNGPTKVVGKIGQGLSFDGTDDHIVAGTSTSWDSLFSSGITISAWVKFPNFTPYQRVVTIPNTAAIYDTWLQVNQTTALVQVGAGGSGKYKTGTTALAANTWYHIVGVTDYTSGGTKVYVNGVDDGGTVNSTPTYTADKNALYIGRLDTSYPAGTFDEIRVYNRALSASEITALYNSGR